MINTSYNKTRRIVLFDLNGTLMDDTERAVNATNYVMRSYDLENVDEKSFRAGFNLPLYSWLATMGVPPNELKSAEKTWNREMEAPAFARADAVETVLYLKSLGVATGVVSAVGDSAMKGDLTRNGLLPLFDMTHSEVNDKHACLSNIRRRFDQAFYIGDTVYDAESAKTSGCTSIALTGGHQLSEALKQAEPHHLIDNLSEVRNIIGPADE